MKYIKIFEEINSDFWFNWANKQNNINPKLIEFLKLNLDLLEYETPRSWYRASNLEYKLRNNSWQDSISKSEVIKIYRQIVSLESATEFAEYLEDPITYKAKIEYNL